MSAVELPTRLGQLHRVAGVDDVVSFELVPGLVAELPAGLLNDIVEGAGFELIGLGELVGKAEDRDGSRSLKLRRLHTLADHVGPDMAVLICGLNPSPASAESGVGFHRPGNRFWPAALAAGLATVDRDPAHALANHGLGMTDIVKRTTRRADEIAAAEFRSGMERVERLVVWLEPQAVCMVGLGGWRTAVDRNAQRGWQTQELGGGPVYVMASTSGLNAHDTVDTLTIDFQTVMAGFRPTKGVRC